MARLRRVERPTPQETRRTLSEPGSTQRKPSWVKAGGDLPGAGPSYVGLDLSLAKTGCVALGSDWCWWRLHKPALKDMAGGGLERLSVHRALLNEFLDAIPEPAAIFVEGYSYGSKGSAVFQIAEWGGIARLVLYDRGLLDRVYLLPPQTLKKFVTGKGVAQKNVVLREVFRVWGFEAEDDNIADAYGLAQAAMTVSTGEARYAWQRDALRRTGPLRVAADEH